MSHRPKHLFLATATPHHHHSLPHLPPNHLLHLLRLHHQHALHISEPSVVTAVGKPVRFRKNRQAGTLVGVVYGRRNHPVVATVWRAYFAAPDLMLSIKRECSASASKSKTCRATVRRNNKHCFFNLWYLCEKTETLSTKYYHTRSVVVPRYHSPKTATTGASDPRTGTVEQVCPHCLTLEGVASSGADCGSQGPPAHIHGQTRDTFHHFRDTTEVFAHQTLMFKQRQQR